MRRFLILALTLFPLPLAALEIRVHPGEVVDVYEAEPQRGLYTVVLQNVAVVQRDGAPVTVESLEIQAVSSGQILQTLYSRGIPIVFKNTVVEGLGFEGCPLQTGWIVTAR